MKSLRECPSVSTLCCKLNSVYSNVLTPLQNLDAVFDFGLVKGRLLIQTVDVYLVYAVVHLLLTSGSAFCKS